MLTVPAEVIVGDIEGSPLGVLASIALARPKSSTLIAAVRRAT